MNLLLTTRVALRALRKNKMRAGLTVLGVVIGIAAVTTMVSIGQSAGALVEEQFRALGTNMLIVLPGSQRRGGVRQSGMPTLTSKDAEAMAEECPAVLATSPLVGFDGQVICGNTNWKPKELFGVGTDYLKVRNRTMRYGGFFTDRDITSADKVCVIGRTLVAKLFQTTNPMGKAIRIGNIPFRIVGILEEKGAGIDGSDQDDVVLMPYTTVSKRLYRTGFDIVHAIFASARSVDSMADAEMQINQLLYERHRIPPGEKADFRIMNLTEMADALKTVAGILTVMLSSIAGISLLVGGVGIMNIMLVSVTERTREIGIRMAVGARGRDILRQFLVESVLLSSIGGVIGFALGVAASSGLTLLISSMTGGTKWPVVVSIPAAIVAMLFAGAVGTFFGYYPARRASKLDPIESLRYE